MSGFFLLLAPCKANASRYNFPRPPIGVCRVVKGAVCGTSTEEEYNTEIKKFRLFLVARHWAKAKHEMLPHAPAVAGIYLHIHLSVNFIDIANPLAIPIVLNHHGGGCVLGVCCSCCSDGRAGWYCRLGCSSSSGSFISTARRRSTTAQSW